MNWNDLKTKFTSRKFMVAVAGIIGGIALLLGYTFFRNDDMH